MPCPVHENEFYKTTEKSFLSKDEKHESLGRNDNWGECGGNSEIEETLHEKKKCSKMAQEVMFSIGMY